MYVNIGELRHRITVLRPRDAPDEAGNLVEQSRDARRCCRSRRKSRTGMPSRSRKLSIAWSFAIGKTFEIRILSGGEIRL